MTTWSQGETHEIQASMSRTAPGLLLAMPQLKDPNFDRTVVLMLEHNAQGALGFVVNRPTDIKVTDVFSSMDFVWGGDGDTCVWNGGPVMREIGWILHEPVTLNVEDEGTEIVPGLQLSTTPERLRALAERPPRRIRFLLGAAGWGPNQLEGELREGCWMTTEIKPDLIFGSKPDKMWDLAYRSMGIDPAMLVQCQGIH